MAIQTLTGYPLVQDVPEFIAFLADVFGAKKEMMEAGPAGGYHAEVTVGDTLIMTGGGGPGLSWKGNTQPMAFHIYVPDVDATYRAALERGAESLQAPTDMDWGERTAHVRDPAGNFWYVATFRGEDYLSEGAPTVQPFLQPERSEPVIDFIVCAFGAVELGRATGPDGAILHTTLKVGNSAMELHDAHDGYPPMPGMFYVYVDDADAAYARALGCGASSLVPPADQPYGDRSGSVKDVAGNTWYVAARLG